MKKYFYNFYLILININNYGFIEILKALFIELYYLLIIKDYKSWLHDDKYTNSYEDTKKDDDYNAQHTPTPYYFLTIANKFIKKKKIDDFILVDFGCGYGRVGKFFINKFNCLFYGLEINKKMIDDLDKEKNKNFFLHTINLKDKISRKIIFDEIKSHNKTVILFISDSFDINTIHEITRCFENTKHYLIGINIKESKKLLINYDEVFLKEFNTKSRHVFLLSPKI